MTTDDDKQTPEPDPWAGLDIGGAEGNPDGLAFDFSELEDDQPADRGPAIDERPVDQGLEFSFEAIDAPVEEPTTAAFDGGGKTPDGFGDQPVVGGALREDEGEADPTEQIPLAVFPPPEGEADGSDILIGTGRSGIIPIAEAADAPAADDVAVDGLDDEEFGDDEIARELALADLASEPIAGESSDFADGLGGSADFGEPVSDGPAEDVSFEAGMHGEGFPFASHDDVGEQGTAAGESGQEEVDSIAFPAAAAAAGAAAAAAGPVVGRATSKARGGGLGQMVGVVLGGLMALPVTYAILIWGFHKDPFKFAKKAPPQLAFLLPEKLQPGYKSPQKVQSNRGPKGGGSLDEIPAGDEAAAPPAESLAETPAETSTSDAGDGAAEPMDVADSLAAPEASANPNEPDVEPVETAGKTEPVPVPDEPVAPGKPVVPVADAAAEVAVAGPAMAADQGIGGGDPLTGLDGLLAEPTPSPAAATPEPLPPLDWTGVETAVERASHAFDALDGLSDPADPARDRLAVAWYRRLAEVGEELVRLETAAAGSGRPLSQSPEAVSALFDRVCGSDVAKRDLERLGRMWLTKEKRRADGVTLLATLDSARQVGPYWSTRAVLSSQLDGAERTVSVISRLAPPAEPGERILISGVLFDGNAVWAADVRPGDRSLHEGSGQE